MIRTVFVRHPGHFVTQMGVSKTRRMRLIRMGGANHYHRLLLPKTRIVLRSYVRGGPGQGAHCSVVMLGRDVPLRATK